MEKAGRREAVGERKLVALLAAHLFLSYLVVLSQQAELGQGELGCKCIRKQDNEIELKNCI